MIFLSDKNVKNWNSQRSDKGVPQYVSEETVSPFSGVGIKDTVEHFLAHGLGVNDVGHSFDALKSFQRLQQNPPGCALA